MKVGADLANDLRRGRLIRSIIDDPQHYPPGDSDPARLSGCPALAGKNAGPTGAVLMIDANQVWDVQQAIDYVSSLTEIKPWCAHAEFYFPRLSFFRFMRRRAQTYGLTETWAPLVRFIEEPTAPDDILGHAAIRRALKPHGIGVATGEHAHNRVVFKQLLQADAIDVCQIDSCRLAGVSEVLSVLSMATK